MARHAQKIEKMINVDFQGSMENVPQETRHIILLYHQVLNKRHFLCVFFFFFLAKHILINVKSVRGRGHETSRPVDP